MDLPALPSLRTAASPPRAGSCLCPRLHPNEVSSPAEAPRCFQDRSRPGLNGTGEGGGTAVPIPRFLSSTVLERVRVTPN